MAIRSGRARTWIWIGGVVLAFMMGIAIGAATPTPTPQAKWQPPGVVTITAHGDKTTTVTETPTSRMTTAAVAAGPATTMDSGTYQVGTDVLAGRYKTPGASYCYWARLRDDSGDFTAIIANGNLDGPGSVTINDGEFIELSGACAWTRVP